MPRRLAALAAALALAGPARAHRPADPPAEAPTSPADAVRLAHAHAKRLGLQAARYVRYLDLRGLRFANPAAADRAPPVLKLHVNRLSSEARFAELHEVCPCLYALDLAALDSQDPGRLAKVWETLAPFNPYYVVAVEEPVVEVVKKKRTVSRYFAAGYENGRPYAAGNYDVVEEYEEKVPTGKATRRHVPAAGRTTAGRDLWLPPAETAELVALTGSLTPIIPADLFHDRTAFGEDGRRDHDAYAWLGVKDLDGIKKFVGFDQEAAVRRRQELFAVQRVSGVALNSRQILAYPVPGGWWFESHDCAASRDFYDPKLGRVVRKNAWTNYLADLEHDAEEHVWPLRNRLAGYSATNAKGVIQASVPPNIANNRRAATNDTRIQWYHCADCHERAGLTEFRCDLRATNDPRRALQLGTLAANDAKRVRVETAATGPIYRAFEDAARGYAEAQEECSGLPADKAVEYTREFRAGYEQPVSFRRAAGDLGWEPARLRARLAEYAAWKDARGQVMDPVVAQLAVGQAVRRDHLEDRWVLVEDILAGGNP